MCVGGAGVGVQHSHWHGVGGGSIRRCGEMVGGICCDKSITTQSRLLVLFSCGLIMEEILGRDP